MDKIAQNNLKLFGYLSSWLGIILILPMLTITLAVNNLARQLSNLAGFDSFVRNVFIANIVGLILLLVGSMVLFSVHNKKTVITATIDLILLLIVIAGLTYFGYPTWGHNYIFSGAVMPRMERPLASTF